jgi:hypothetical protein
MTTPGGFRITNRQSGLATQKPGQNTGGGVTTQPFIYGVAQVESIIINEEGSGNNIRNDKLAAKTSGRAKIRLLELDQVTRRKDLYEADPLNPYQSTFPLVGEFVLVFKALGKYYYVGPLNVDRHITQNARPLLGDMVEAAQPSKIRNRQREAREGIYKTPSKIKNKPGYQFIEAEKIQSVKNFEGDVVYQGRYGHSIRFGTSQLHESSARQSPNIVLRTGQAKDSGKVEDKKSSLTIENLDSDATSIYLTSDEVLPFTPATKKSETFLFSMVSKPTSFDGAQILINSDTVTLNSKLKSIYLFSKEGIHMNSLRQGVTIDSEGPITERTLQDMTLLAKQNMIGKAKSDIFFAGGTDVNIDAGRYVVIRSNETYLGGYNDRAEPIVMGSTLKKFFLELLKVLTSTQPLVLGPTGAVNPALVARLWMTYMRYLVVPGPINARWSSDDNHVVKLNEKTQSSSGLFGNGIQI